MSLWRKIDKRIIRLRFKPIRVFCIHQVSDELHTLTTCKGDWIQTESFKTSLLNLKKKYIFISLQEAHKKLQNDHFRGQNFAVLTADDGYRCINDLLPWLEENHIPITLFLNARYLDGYSCSPHILRHARMENAEVTEEEVAEGLYLTESMLKGMPGDWVTLASHGYEHVNAAKLGLDQFVDQIQKNVMALSQFNSYIPFHAYTWGRRTKKTNDVLEGFNLIPVFMDGQMNYNDPKVIHRELLPLIK